MKKQKAEMCRAMQKLVGNIAAGDRQRVRVLLVTPQDCWTWPLAEVLRGELPNDAPTPHNGQTIDTAAEIVARAHKEPAGVLLALVCSNLQDSIPDDVEKAWETADRGQDGKLVEHAHDVHFRVLQVVGDTKTLRQVFERFAEKRYHPYTVWPVHLPQPMQDEMQGETKPEMEQGTKPKARKAEEQGKVDREADDGVGGD